MEPQLSCTARIPSLTLYFFSSFFSSLPRAIYNASLHLIFVSTSSNLHTPQPTQNPHKHNKINLRLRPPRLIRPQPPLSLPLQPFQRLLNQPDMPPQRALQLVHARLVLLEVVVVVLFEIVRHTS